MAPPVEFAEVEVASITLTKLLDENGVSAV